jgi:hypothetical protein
MIFWWAWVNSSETTYLPSHARYDEHVFSFTITHREGECAQLALTIKNPKIGLLAAGRKVWGWLSFSDSGTSGAQPLFFGRLLGIPDMAGSATGFAELLTLTFVAKPIDFHSQRRTLAESLAVLPFYDKLFIDSTLRIEPSTHTGDVDTALEARSARWHCSRGENGLPLHVSYSDICIGEDGTEVWESSTGAPAGVDPSTVNLRISGAPMTSVTVKASVAWTQKMPTGPAIPIGSWQFESYTGDAMLSSWPKVGASLGGGWAAAGGTSVVDTADVANWPVTQYNFTWHNTAKQHKTGDPMSTTINTTTPAETGTYVKQLLYENSNPGIIWEHAFAMPEAAPPSFPQWSGLPGPDDSGDTINIPMHYDSQWAFVPASQIEASLAVTYEQGRARSEHMNFTMDSDIQPILTDPSDYDTSSAASPPDETILQLNGADVTVAIDGVAPLVDPSASHYFATARGSQSTEYLLLRARALLLNAARLVELSWSIPFARAVHLTCRKNATLVWNQLPGGQATGKITQYTITADGNSGKIGGTITVMASVGRGISETTQHGAIAGTSYAVAGYVAFGYDENPGSQVTVAGNGLADIAYAPIVYSFNENPMPLTAADILVSAGVGGAGALEQEALIKDALISVYSSALFDMNAKKNASSLASSAIALALSGENVFVEIALRNVDSLALDDANDLIVQPLLVPMTVNLESTA